MCLTAFAAIGCFGIAFTHWNFSDPIQFLCYFVVALMASSLKVTLPGIDGTMSVNFLFILLGVLEMSFAETLMLVFGSVLIQCYWKSSKPLKAIQVIFNLSQFTVATAAAYGIYRYLTLYVLHGPQPLALIIAAVTYFAFNTSAMAVVISISEKKKIREVWANCYFWSFPYYLVGAAVAGAMHFLDRRIGWQSALLVVPAVYLIYRSYRLYLGKLEYEKVHAEEMSSLHLRTIEALALAIEAKDQTTHQHLQRVRVYAMEIAKELGLTNEEIEALRAASLLHDIGKLAVPEHIISKPGKLTPEEFEKMKIHPIIGAEILEQVQFPYPVVPIVRYHHEKWDGSGYPSGIKGEEIPIGARILSAVDCLDALASDRQYRRALPLDQAMQKVVRDSGKSFDPRIVRNFAKAVCGIGSARSRAKAVNHREAVHRYQSRTGNCAGGRLRRIHQPDFAKTFILSRLFVEHCGRSSGGSSSVRVEPRSGNFVEPGRYSFHAFSAIEAIGSP